jgi:hypothetical protein
MRRKEIDKTEHVEKIVKALSETQKYDKSLKVSSSQKSLETLPPSVVSFLNKNPSL